MELNSNQIMEIIPHRYPFLLIDKVIAMEPGVSATSIKCVTANELHFCGHFPEHHVMPGVLIVEALAQTGAVAILAKEENKGKIAFFGGIKDCKFKKQVVPGDTLELTVNVVRIKGPIGIGEAVAKVDGKIACKATLTFAIG